MARELTVVKGLAVGPIETMVLAARGSFRGQVARELTVVKRLAVGPIETMVLADRNHGFSCGGAAFQARWPGS